MNESEQKPWYKSITLIGAAVSTVSGLMAAFQVNIADLAPDLTSGLLGLGTLVGAVMTVVGRVKAGQNGTTLTK